VTVKAEITQSTSRYYVTDTEVHLYPGQSTTITVRVFTDDVEHEKIYTNITFYEKGDEENEFSRATISPRTTTIRHKSGENADSTSSGETTPTFLIIAGSVSLFVLVVSSVYVKEGTLPLPLVGGYSKLKKERILENEGRKRIHELLLLYDGLKFIEIVREGGFKHRSHVHYHLKRLREYGYVKKVGKLYFATEPPALSEEERKRTEQAKQRDRAQEYYYTHQEEIKEKQRERYARKGN